MLVSADKGGSYLKKILVLTHNDFIGHLVTLLLKKEGVICSHVRDPQTAFEHFQKEPFDALLFQATIENSEAFIQQVKRDYPNLPILSTCFFNRIQMQNLEKLTGRTPFTIPFSEETLKEQLAQLTI